MPTAIREEDELRAPTDPESGVDELIRRGRVVLAVGPAFRGGAGSD